MSDSKIVIRGLPEYTKALSQMGTSIMPSLRKTMARAVAVVHQEVPPYPPPLPTSDRTGMLGKQIGTDVKSLTGSSGVAGIIFSPTPYSPWVISSEEVPDGRGPQAAWHKGRWWTLQGVVEKARPKVLKLFKDEIQSLADDFNHSKFA